MSFLLSAVLLGLASGSRAFAGLAVISWAARLGYLPLEHTWVAFLGYAFNPYILTLAALGEMVNDKRSTTPSRLIPVQFTTRVITGTLCGVSVGLATGHVVVGLLAGAVGSIAGTVGGARVRRYGANLLGRDLPAALIEDGVAIGFALVAVTICAVSVIALPNRLCVLTKS